MQYKLFAAIAIGSYEVEMKIFELSAQKGIKEIDHLRHRLELGKETYADGKVSMEKIENLAEVLQSFKETMEGYRVEDYRICAASAVREARNKILLLDYLQKRTGLRFEVLSNSEQRFLDYKSIASSENEFNKIIQKGTAIFDVGGSSIQLSLFDKESLVSTQNIRIGNLRVRERLGGMIQNVTHVERLIDDLVKSELISFKKMYMKDREVKHLIVAGDNFREVVKVPSMSREEFFELYSEITEYSIDYVTKKMDVPAESIAMLLPSLTMYKCFIEESDVETIWIPGLNICDGMAYEYAQKNKMIRSGHNFEEDIIAAAKNMAKRYMCSKSHIKLLEELSLGIFDKTKKLHGLDKRKRLLLQIAAILHGCGKYISMANGAESSYHIIMATEIIGLSHAEREMVANIVRYNTQEFEDYDMLDENCRIPAEEYLTVAKLSAILRVANALDRSHRQKFKNVKITLKEKELLIMVETPEDITLEQGLFQEKADFFQEVFRVRPVIRKKKTV